MTKVLFMGRKPVAARCLEWLCAQQGVEVVGVFTDSHLAVSPTSDTARSRGLALYDFDAGLAALQCGELDFDLGLSVLYWRKLRDEYLELPDRGFVNFHPAPLPEYKGVGGYNLAILDGLSEWAATAHYVDQSIDTGPIIEVARFPIDSETETAKTIEAKSQKELFALFVSVVTKLIASPFHLPSSPNIGGRHLSRKGLEEMKRVDLQADDVARKIRAFWFPPYDGAYIEVDGEKYTLIDRGILESLADPESSSLFTESARSGEKNF